MAKWAQGVYDVMNKAKYAGTSKPRYRSSWELVFMQFCDNNDNIVQWASEPIRIPYQHPITGKTTTYVPDFLVMYRDKNNNTKTELVEIKPKKQSILESKASNRDKTVAVINLCKWDAAQRWCRANGLTFRVITEEQIFHQGGKRK